MNDFWFEDGEWHFEYGWHRYNPHEVKCEECGSWDVEWFWEDGEVHGFRCNKCGIEEMDEK